MRPKMFPKPPIELKMNITEIEKWRMIESRDGTDLGPG
jgi:hypothetical protein